MKSTYSHVLTLIAAILAFVPVMGVDWLLDNYVRVRERATLQQSLEAIANRIENGAYDGRPVDVEVMADGSMLVSDDLTGAVYRISYTAP